METCSNGRSAAVLVVPCLEGIEARENLGQPNVDIGTKGTQLARGLKAPPGQHTRKLFEKKPSPKIRQTHVSTKRNTSSEGAMGIPQSGRDWVT